MKVCLCEGCGRAAPNARRRVALVQMPQGWCGYGAQLARPSATALWCPTCQADGTMLRDDAVLTRPMPRRRADRFTGRGLVSATLANGAEVQVDFTALTPTALADHLRQSGRLLKGMARRARAWVRRSHA